MGKIDETLVERHNQRTVLHHQLKKFIEDGSHLADLPLLKKEIRIDDKNIPSLLLDIMMEEEGEISNLALLLLTDHSTPDVAIAAERLLTSPKLSKMHRSRLAAFLLLEQEQKGVFSKALQSEQGVNKLLHFLNAFWQQVDPLDVGRLWLEDYYDLPVREKIPLLKSFLATQSASYLPIYSIELGSPHVSLSRLVAKELATVANEKTLSMLKSFPVLRDTAARLSMDESINTLQEKRRNGELEPAGKETRFSFYKAFAAEEESAGFISVIFSKKQSGGPIRFMFTLIDRWDKGVLNCYGDVVEEEAALHQIVQLLNQKSELIQYSRVKRDYAMWILKKAEKLTIDRGYSLPPEYLMCRCLLWDEEPSAKKYPTLFGLTCCECGAPIQMTKDHYASWLIGDIALCPECIETKNHCENCGVPIKPELCYALARTGMHHITVICESCYKKAGKSQDSPRKK